MNNKTKVSAFEFAIASVADPESAKNMIPETRKEELKRRKNNLLSTSKKLAIHTTHDKGKEVNNG